MAANSLEDRNDIGVIGAGFDGATVNKDRRAVQSSHAHQQARHVLVATADGNDAVVAHAAGYRLHAVGNYFAGDKGVLHALGAHGDAVGNRQHVINDALTTGHIGPFVNVFRQLVDVHIAGCHHAPG